MRTTASLLIAMAAFLAILATGADADSHAKKKKNCTAPGYERPADLESEHKLCTTSAVGDYEAKANAAADSVIGNFSATDIGSEARGGEKLMNKILVGGFSDSTDDIIAYGRSLVILIAPPAIFLILNFCCCFWCSCMRGCCWLCPSCCKTCKCLPSDERAYSKCQKCVPALVWLILSLCVFIFAIMGVISGTYKLVDSVSASVCEFDNAFIQFKAFMNNVEQPLTRLGTKFSEAVDDMKGDTAFPPALTQGLNDLGYSLGVIEKHAAAAKAAASPAPAAAAASCNNGGTLNDAYCTNADVKDDKTGCKTVVWSDETSIGAGDQACSNGGLLNTGKTACVATTFVAADTECKATAFTAAQIFACSNGGVVKSDDSGCEATSFTSATCTNADVKDDKTGCKNVVWSDETSTGAGDQACSNGGLLNTGKTACEATSFSAATCVNANVKADKTGCEAPQLSGNNAECTNADLTTAMNACKVPIYAPAMSASCTNADLKSDKSACKTVSYTSAEAAILCEKSWQEIVDASEEAKKGTYKSAEELNDVLKDIQKMILDKIVGQSGPVTDKIDEATSTIADMKKRLDDRMNPKQLGLFQYAETARDQRDTAAFTQWGWVFLVVVFAIFGILGMLKCKKEVNFEPDGQHPRSNPTLSGDAMKLNAIGSCCARFGTLSWCIYLVFATIGALFALIFLPLTAVVSDACLVLPTLPHSGIPVGENYGGSSLQNLTDTCWNETGNLFDGFGLNEVISTDDIDFGNLTESRENPEISDADLIKLKESLDKMNSTARLCFDSGNTGGAVTDLYEAIAYSRLNVTQAEDNFKEDSTAQNLQESGEAIIFAVDEAVCQFKNAATCFFIKKTWDGFSKILCNQVNAGLSNMALYELLIAALAIPYALAMLCLNRKIGGHGPTKMDESAYSVDAKEINAVELAGSSYYN